MAVTRHAQLRWLALLTVAVLLPTVSLLWFMTRVVANEKLVIQQKLTAIYLDRLADAGQAVEESVRLRLQPLAALRPNDNPYAVLRGLIASNHAQGLVAWDASGALIYPRLDESHAADSATANALAEAWDLELRKHQFGEAAAAYARFEDHPSPAVAAAATLGRSRSLARLGRVPEAVAAAEAAAFPSSPIRDSATRLTVQHLRLFLLHAAANSNVVESARLRSRVVEALRSEVFSARRGDATLTPAQNLFIARKVLEALESGGQMPRAASELAEWIAAESRSLAAAEAIRPAATDGPRVAPLDLGEERLYGLRSATASGTALALLTTNGLAALLAPYFKALADDVTSFRILDAAGTVILESGPAAEKAFATALLPDVFPGWKIALHFRGSDVFQRAAQRQIAVYIWTAVLVIVLILIAAALAMQAIGRQIRLNQMKNDFIATVSHELKTPLASMRVLIDTLLEGNVRSEEQARDYLRLTARENERLSRLIDRFLTFSRMERNKAAFSLRPAEAGELADSAAESVRNKHTEGRCPIRVAIEPGLPRVVADSDAMVTVLVNLLENACKYTDGPKEITLRVRAESPGVSFEVSDQGIGIARRHLRKIFDRFYQVDNSLARRAEGCGLGLSIVKFIVQGHKGRVTVESEPGKGSTFKVWIPAEAINHANRSHN